MDLHSTQTRRTLKLNVKIDFTCQLLQASNQQGNSMHKQSTIVKIEPTHQIMLVSQPLQC